MFGVVCLTTVIHCDISLLPLASMFPVHFLKATCQFSRPLSLSLSHTSHDDKCREMLYDIITCYIIFVYVVMCVTEFD